MGKSVAELAQACKTSTTTIYRILKDVQQDNAEYSTALTEKKKGITYFTEEGERIIKERLNAVEQNGKETSTQLNDVEHVERSESAEILFLRKQNETLLEELSKQREEASKDREEMRKEREQNQIILEKEREHSRQQAERVLELSDKLTQLTENGQTLLREQNASKLLIATGQQQDILVEPSGIQEENRSGGFLNLKKLFKGKKKDSQ